MQVAHVPGMVVAIADNAGSVSVQSFGTDAAGRALAPDTLLPIASITKLATALAILRLADQGMLAPDDELALHLPEAVAAQPGVTLAKLLSHTAGLPVDVRNRDADYGPGLDWPALADACLHTELQTPPDTRVQYGNVGYGLLALIVERYTGQDFATALRTLVLEPLAIEAYLQAELPRPPGILADVRGRHKQTEIEPFNSAFWRSLALPWAGLVTTAAGALRLIEAFRRPPDGFLRPETVSEATGNQAGDLGGGQARPLVWPRCPWGLGPELRGEKTPHWAPPEAHPDSFGHAGASGCIAWADPSAGVAWALLGTRTADSGWVIRHATAVGAAIIAEARASQSQGAA